MRTFGEINTRCGRGTLKLATGLQAQTLNPTWTMRRTYLPSYTTNLAEAPKV
ncbi:MAG: DUF4113 domain-containing protein [Treponema sp.]|nr:DUF4113 domain-containing protein [Treponema sp.]